MSDWQSRRKDLSGKEKIRQAIEKQELGEQTRALFRSESGRALILGEIVLEALLSLPGRVLVAALSLFFLWLLL